MILQYYTGDYYYTLTNQSFCYFLSYDGFLFPSLHRLSERGPLQHGDTDRGYRLDPRYMTMKIGIMGDDMDSFYRKRAIIYKTFAPSNDTSSIKLTYGTTERQIDCHCIEIAEGNRNYLWQEYVLSFKANDPTWYDPTLNVRTFNLSGGADKMEVPTVIPMTVGASSINAYETIVLEGDVQTFPRIRIHGPITGPVITNVRTDDKLDFSGTTISAGNYYDIDCRYGYKTVEDQDGTNQISNLSNDSDIATFSFIVEEPLESWGKLNSINVTGTGCTDATQITIRYYDRFLGV